MGLETSGSNLSVSQLFSRIYHLTVPASACHGEGCSAGDWFVFLVWELSVPPETVNYLGSQCCFFGAWAELILHRTALVSRQPSFLIFCLFRDYSCLSAVYTVSTPWIDGPQVFRQQFPGHQSGGRRHGSHLLYRLKSQPCAQCSSSSPCYHDACQAWNF